MFKSGRSCDRPGVRWIIIAVCLVLIVLLWHGVFEHPVTKGTRPQRQPSLTAKRVEQCGRGHEATQQQRRTEQWLAKHSSMNVKVSDHPALVATRPKAALISLVRNEELPSILQSMRELEYDI